MDVSFDVFHHDDGVVNRQTNRQHDCQQRQKVEGEPEGLHQEDPADQGHRNGDHRHEYGTVGAEEEEDDDHDDEQRVGEGPHHLVNRVADVFGRVIGDADIDACGGVPFDRLHLLAHPLNDIDDIGIG